MKQNKLKSLFVAGLTASSFVLGAAKLIKFSNSNPSTNVEIDDILSKLGKEIDEVERGELLKYIEELSRILEISPRTFEILKGFDEVDLSDKYFSDVGGYVNLQTLFVYLRDLKPETEQIETLIEIFVHEMVHVYDTSVNEEELKEFTLDIAEFAIREGVESISTERASYPGFYTLVNSIVAGENNGEERASYTGLLRGMTYDEIDSLIESGNTLITRKYRDQSHVINFSHEISASVVEGVRTNLRMDQVPPNFRNYIFERINPSQVPTKEIIPNLLVELGQGAIGMIIAAILFIVRQRNIDNNPRTPTIILEND